MGSRIRSRNEACHHYKSCKDTGRYRGYRGGAGGCRGCTGGYREVPGGTGEYMGLQGGTGGYTRVGGEGAFTGVSADSICEAANEKKGGTSFMGRTSTLIL